MLTDIFVASGKTSFEDDAVEWWDVPTICYEVGADSKTVMNNILWGVYETARKESGEWLVPRSEVERDFYKSMVPDGYITIKEAARSVPTAYQNLLKYAHKKVGDTAKKVGGRWYISVEEVQGYRDYRNTRKKHVPHVPSAYFPTVKSGQRVVSTAPHRFFDSALENMAIEFTARASELGVSADDCHGQVFVLGKRTGEDYEFEWLVEDGCIYFREQGNAAWGSFASLCHSAFDFHITRSVFLEAVHSALWWHFHLLVGEAAA